jgi:hypothetical protein
MYTPTGRERRVDGIVCHSPREVDYLLDELIDYSRHLLLPNHVHVSLLKAVPSICFSAGLSVIRLSRCRRHDPACSFPVHTKRCTGRQGRATATSSWRSHRSRDRVSAGGQNFRNSGVRICGTHTSPAESLLRSRAVVILQHHN